MLIVLLKFSTKIIQFIAMRGDVPKRVIRVFKLVQYLCDFPPKSIEKLAELLEISPKTAYKDIHILEEIGYEIDKDEKHRYYIKNSVRSEYHLNEEEKKLIIASIQMAGLNSTEVTGIIQKLKSRQLVSDVANLGIMKQLHMIRILVEAIKHKTPVNIIKYRSTSPGTTVRDRVVIPIYFDEMRISVTAYDVEIAETRIFKVARMTDIHPVHTDIQGNIPNNIPIVDTFGYAGTLQHEVSMLLSVRAASILSEEFVQAASHISPSGDQTFPSSYTVRVCGYEGIGRFVLGLMTEIKVTGDEGFKSYLQSKIEAQKLI